MNAQISYRDNATTFAKKAMQRIFKKFDDNLQHQADVFLESLLGFNVDKNALYDPETKTYIRHTRGEGVQLKTVLFRGQDIPPFLQDYRVIQIQKIQVMNYLSTGWIACRKEKSTYHHLFPQAAFTLGIFPPPDKNPSTVLERQLNHIKQRHFDAITHINTALAYYLF